VAGSENNIFFKKLPVAESSQHYYMLGQLAALAIIKIGRGPECLNSQLVKCMFGGDSTGVSFTRMVHWRPVLRQRRGSLFRLMREGGGGLKSKFWILLH
jgi:hypothetical protein